MTNLEYIKQMCQEARVEFTEECDGIGETVLDFECGYLGFHVVMAFDKDGKFTAVSAGIE